MEKKSAHTDVVNVIRKLAGSPEIVRVTRTAYYDMMGWSLEKADVCDAIIKWIDEGKKVEEIMTKNAKGYIGEPAYVTKPLLCEKVFYVKVSLSRNDSGVEELLIVSAHPDHR
jgi:hypothetical protein